MRIAQATAWPPTWVASLRGLDRIPGPEEGTLKKVTLHVGRRNEFGVELVREVGGNEQQAVLILLKGSIERANALKESLEKVVRRPIREVGQLEIPGF